MLASALRYAAYSFLSASVRGRDREASGFALISQRLTVNSCTTSKGFRSSPFASTKTNQLPWSSRTTPYSPGAVTVTVETSWSSSPWGMANQHFTDFAPAGGVTVKAFFAAKTADAPWGRVPPAPVEAHPAAVA